MSNKLYSVKDYAKLVGYSPRHIYRLIDSQKIQAQRLRNRWVITHFSQE
jgi:excisionase family DNA binding protein